WRIAAPSRCSAAGWVDRAVSSTPSMRRRHASSDIAVDAAQLASGIVAEGREGRGALGLLRITEQADPQLGLLQRLLAAAVQADAALVGGERILEAQVTVLHRLDQLFEGVERGFEVGD